MMRERVYIPAGRWFSIHDASVVEGGAERELPAPLDFMPVYQREGTIIAKQVRLRRSASQMLHDPFTLVVMGDAADRAVGHVFHDDRDGYGYQTGDYAYMELTLEDGVLSSRRVDGEKADAMNVVERVVLRVKRVPKKIVIESVGVRRDAEFMVEAATSTITIRKPLVRVTEEWKIFLL